MQLPDMNDLAAQMVAVLAPMVPYLPSVAEGMGKQIGQDVFNQAKKLLGKLRDRFHKDGDNKALATLDLFQEDPQTFEAALSALLVRTLEQHPEWAEEVRQLLAQPALQEIVASNDSVVQRISMNLSGAGQQRIKADASEVTDVTMSIE
ncbi:MAG: hypothetical protein H8E35_03845 [Ardenticatenia bacterium]|nr:hypothetical protein [Ardenticatenia bacterium]